MAAKQPGMRPQAPESLPASTAVEPDGRRRRSRQSRDRIVQAMLELVEAGDVTPGAEAVAARAAVGLRSVFRHFKDMESLYAEMTFRVARHYEAMLAPFETSGWRDQLAEMIERRLTTFERLMPFKRAADAHRHESPALQANYTSSLAMMRSRLSGLLPAALALDPVRFESLDLLLSFDVWQRLRVDQGLEPAAARAVVEGQVALLLAAAVPFPD
jgi:AcrR family transcriptional regulator